MDAEIAMDSQKHVSEFQYIFMKLGRLIRKI